MANWSASYTWQTYGSSWNVEPGSCSTFQGQSTAASGSILLLGAASISQQQTTAASGQEVFLGSNSTSQQQTVAVSAVSAITGPAATSQLQSATTTGIVSIYGVASAAQVQSILGAGRQVEFADIDTRQVQSASATGGLIILGGNSAGWSEEKTWLTQPLWGNTSGTDQFQEVTAYSFDVSFGDGVASNVGQSSFGYGAVEYFVSGAAAVGQIPSEFRLSGSMRQAGEIHTGSGQQRLRSAGQVSFAGAARTAASGQVATGIGTVEAPAPFRESLGKLLKYPHRAVFDKSAVSAAAVAFDDYDGALSWSIRESVLEVRLGGVTRYFGLADVTVAELVERMRNSGIGVRVVDSDFSPLTAIVLLDDGGVFKTDRSPMLGFTSLLWVLFYAYAKQVADGRYQVMQALRQMIITQAEDEWLDLWGDLYAVDRLQGEADKHYAPRIPQEAFRIRVNALAIEKAIFDATGWDVRIEEPWKEIFTLDVSVLSGPDRLYDGGRIGYHLIRPVARESVDWVQVMRVIDRNRAAGVLVVEAESRRSKLVETNGVYVVESSVTRNHSQLLPYQDRVFLDYALIEDQAVPNHPAIYRAIDGMFRRTEVSYIDTASLDNSDVEDVGILNNASTLRREKFYVSESALSNGQSWDTAPSWGNARASWSALREQVEVRASRSS